MAYDPNYWAQPLKLWVFGSPGNTFGVLFKVSGVERRVEDVKVINKNSEFDFGAYLEDHGT